MNPNSRKHWDEKCVYGLAIYVSVIHKKFIVLKVCHEVSDGMRISEKGFSNVLSCIRSLKRASPRLSELLKFGYCQELAWASSSLLERAFMCQTWETSLERVFKFSSWVCSLKWGRARLSENSSWQTYGNRTFGAKVPKSKPYTHAFHPEQLYNLMNSIHGNNTS